MNWTQANLQSQFNHATANGWIALFTDIATSAGFPVEFVLAIASRETNMLNIKGDFHDGIYHGFGIMQVDVGTDAAFCNSWTAADVSGSIQRGTQILAQKRDTLAAGGITDFKPIAAAYNAGASRVISAVNAGADPDTRTTGGDYGSDVVARMAVFVTLLPAAPAAAAPAAQDTPVTDDTPDTEDTPDVEEIS